MINAYITPDMIDLLERLCNADGASGNEGAVRKIIREEIGAYADTITTDPMGNLIATRKTGTPKLRVMVAAHMDEVSFMIVNSTDDEFFEFRNLGGIDPKVLPAKTIRIGKRQIPGVISPRTAHLTTAAERKMVVAVDKLQITVGVKDKKKISPGDYACFDTAFCRMGEAIVAKALDDRVGCANLIWLFQHPPKDVELIGVFTVQEELGLRGAGVGAYQIHPDVAFALDTTPALEPPMWDSTETNVQYNVKAGHGPAIYTVDSGQIHFEKMIQFLTTTAESNDIPFQFRQPGGGGTDSGAIHLQFDGILSQSLSVPVRYLHTPRGMMRISDWEDTLHLLDAALNTISDAFSSENKE